ncbi:hypothetical protein QBZ16_001795 [Prototheca wickerhamii]|uniref:CCR4-Not complex component Not1 C-terminal domain-containing protein n=1 Tax=Prototheca wickerhamii TaxID=3111 RepID=A0AAD9IGE3_PROWI|nr:hypothetical protein QBZ16_001795 [Prototheca wickerhamii]
MVLDPASPLSIPRAGDAAPFRSMRQAAAALAVYICLRQATEAALGEDGAAAMAALTDQLRFPSAHTAAASAAVLGVFARAQAADEAALEQLTRVMLERLIATRPHPWGLLVTFIELLKNARYGFRAHEFTRCAPDIERLFDSLSRSAGSGAGSS